MVTGISRVYNNQEFEVVNSKITVLFTAIMTILMVFFGSYGKQILLNDEKKKLVQVSGICGISCCLSSLLDAMLRPKVPDFHLTGEIAILSAYGCLCSLVYAIFEDDYSRLCIAVFAAGLVGGFVLPVVVLKCRVIPVPPPPKSDSRLDEVMKRIGRKGDTNGTLHLATIFAILMKPEAPETTVLVQAMRDASPEVPPEDPKEGIEIVVHNPATGGNLAPKTAASISGPVTRSKAKKPRVAVV